MSDLPIPSQRPVAELVTARLAAAQAERWAKEDARYYAAWARLDIDAPPPNGRTREGLPFYQEHGVRWIGRARVGGIYVSRRCLCCRRYQDEEQIWNDDADTLLPLLRDERPFWLRFCTTCFAGGVTALILLGIAGLMFLLAR